MIKISDLSFSYADRNVFDGFSAAIPDRAIITGASGAGKTTLLRLIAGLEKPIRGSIEGRPDRIAFMFQEDRLLPWLSALLNVTAALPSGSQALAAAGEMLERAGLGEAKNALPGKLSGGQCRRVALARALCYRGELLLLDEPFKGMDPALTLNMAALIKTMNIPFIAVLHSEEELKTLGGTVLKI